jgi:pSer/pThr/pTyr-binding forkhead associated (FHA) protein
MPVRLVALDDGPDIVLDQEIVVVGRHPSCDARLDSLRLSRHHCCLTIEGGKIVVQDLGSTNGIRINGLRVKTGCLRAGDILSIAHFRYRVDQAPRLRRADLSHLRATDYLFTGSRFGFISRN